MYTLIAEASTKEVQIDITDKDCQRWMRAIQKEAESSGRKIGSKKNFEDLAFDILDKDSKFKHLSNGELAKLDVIDDLWKAHRGSTSKQAETQPAGKGQPNKVEEENEVVIGKPAIQKPMANVLGKDGATPSLSAIMSNAFKAGSECSSMEQARGIRNPYSKGSSRNSLWQKHFDRGVVKGLGRAVEQEDEEDNRGNTGIPPTVDDGQPSIDDVPDTLPKRGQSTDDEAGDIGDEFPDNLDDDELGSDEESDLGGSAGNIDNPVELAGYVACAQVHELADDEVDMVNPFPHGSKEYEAYLRGWHRALGDLGFDELDDEDGSDAPEFEFGLKDDSLELDQKS